MQYSIQLWASKNIFSARILLIVLHTILGYFSYFTALNVADHLQIPLSIVFVPLLLSVLFLLNYREKEAPKFVPILLIGLRMLFWFFVGVQLSHFADEREVVTESEISHFAAYKAEATKEIFVITTTNKFLSAWKKLIQRDKRMVKLDPDESGTVTLIIIGSILGIIAIVFLGLWLSCSLSCAGSEGAALLVIILGILGIVGIIYLASERISELLGPSRKKEQERLRQNRSLNRNPPTQPPKPRAETSEAPVPKVNTQPSITTKIEPPAPKASTPPSATPKLEPPAPILPSKKKMTKKERIAEKKLDKGIVWAKILTVVALVGLIIFTIISSKF